MIARGAQAVARGLGPPERERFGRDGVLFPVAVLAGQEVAALSALLAEVERGVAALGGEPRRIALPHLYWRWAYDLATHPAVLDAVESLLGPDLLIQATMILTKPAHDPAVVTWHQDGTYSGLHKTPNATAWIALTASTPENGCMRVVPGSQRNPILPHVESQAENHLLRHSPEVAVAVDEAEAVDVVLRAGEMSLHHSNIIHGSNPNRSDGRRSGFIVRFVTPALAAGGHAVVRARGGAGCGHLRLLAQPPPDDLAAGLSRWAADAALRPS